MKQTGCIIIALILLFCAGCSFEKPQSNSTDNVDSVAGIEEHAVSDPKEAQTPDGMPDVIDGAAATAKPGTGGDLASETRYIGNIQSKVFHKENCSTAQKISDKNRKTFSTRAEAFESGFRPCRQCQP